MINYCQTCKYRLEPKSEKRCMDCSKGNLLNWEPEEAIQIKVEKRPELLPRPLPIYERTDSEIPERIRISFTNGTSAIYDLHTDQPAPQLVESIRIIRKWNTGYQAPAERRRRRR